ncbi:interleukin-15 [Python bivittatus]|uniref:Interleukin n=1 Tax=Python bivittatus TaxID=176946 RepID=A0A9F5MXS0_PYTBI|nr:interleukin-15 [Python bivittatus]
MVKVHPVWGQEIFKKEIMISNTMLKSVLQVPKNLKKKFLVFYLILSSCLLPIQATTLLAEVLLDLEKIQVSSEIDAFLYTADLNYPSHCNVSVIKCFQLEMEVVLYESKFGDSKFCDSVHRIVRIIKKFLSHEMNIDTRTCQRCETYKEKNYSEFIANFMSVLRRINREEKTNTVY